MFTRILETPKESVFLFGPRGTGKSTWLQQRFKEAIFYDLLDTGETLRLSRQPNLLYQELQSKPEGTWIVLDEVQKVPALLNEVHRLIENQKLKFVLSGSSARKLKKESDNLLAGRARQTHLFPLVSQEVDFNFRLEEVLQFGMLPLSFTGDDKIGFLKTYAETYLKEEIKAEALTRNIGSFARFLEIAARQNGQVTNVSSISRDAEVARQTVQGFFEILKDTLIGDWLYPWKLKPATKQVTHPKFYLFDPGVARSLSGRLPYPPSHEELGPLLETFILNELKAYISYSNLHYPLYFWNRHSNVEVDFICETKNDFVAIECKMADRWTNQCGKGLRRIQEEMSQKKIRTFGVFNGPREQKWGSVDVMPTIDFLKKLWNGQIID